MADIVSNMPAKPVEVSVDNSRLLLQGGSARFELPLMPLDDYPQLPTLPEVTGTLDTSTFVNAVTQVASAAGRDDTLPMLTGVHMEISGNKVNLAATDRFRLALRSLEWDPVAGDVQAKLLVPAKTLLDNARTLDSHLQDPVEIAVGTGENVGGDGLFGLHSQNRETTTRMLDAEFPNIQPLLPKTHTSMASVEIAPLVEAIRRVSLVADRNAQLRMHFKPGEVSLYLSLIHISEPTRRS